ncbi:MAG: TetR/AcrR family transcriptional regulator [Pseudomonadota bacterium]
MTARTPQHRTPKPARPRSPGRPSNDPAIRDRMLEIALREFAAHGFRGVSVATIAREAGATPAMIHYYFGSKQGLYEAVLEHALGPILASLQAATEHPPEDEDLLPRFIHGYMRLMAENPQVPSLIVLDVLSPGGQMRDTFVQGFAGRGGRGLRDLVRHAQKLGTLRGDLDPDLAALSLLSMAVFPFVGRPVAGQVLDYSIDPERIGVLAEHTLRLFYQGAGA